MAGKTMDKHLMKVKGKHGQVEQEVTFWSPASMDEVREVIATENEDVDGVILALVKGRVKHAAINGKAGDVRKELDKKEADKPAIEKAVAAWLANSEQYVPGSATTRGRIAGVTKTDAGKVGKALLEMDAERLKALAAEMGVDLS